MEPILSAHLDTNRLCKYNDEICGMHILLENDSVLCLGFFCFLCQNFCRWSRFTNCMQPAYSWYTAVDIQLETTAKNLCGKSVYQPRPIRLQTPECKRLVKPDQLVLMFRLYFLSPKIVLLKFI